MAKVMAAMSGGVDSSVVAAILKNQGHNTLGATLRLVEDGGVLSKEVLLAKEVCEKLNIPHNVYDMREDFRKEIITRFINEYENGLTPNPCVECNKYIKFGGLLEKAINEGCDYIATGHYSKISFNNQTGRYAITRPKDFKKDQTYVLWQLSQEQLSHILMPLGELTKEEVREIATQYGFSSAGAKDSQDICFVPDGNYAAFIQSHTGVNFEKGNYTDIYGKVLGQHLGHQCYTIGQRKGLGIALGKPQFVISKDPGTNNVVLGDEEHIFKTHIYIKDINFMAQEYPKSDVSCTAKLRYSARDEECIFHPISETEAMLEFKKPQRAATPGQSAVLYLDDILLGGGKIVKGE
ncbi:MAG: tRNA 2-thiouridine(34) synthase MnmA [Clostridia bacterium]|nr:tRNA 2-thiouridine(34) synthase MnmA [Clostridia bacterium]